MGIDAASLVGPFPLSQPLEEVFITQKFGENKTAFYKELGMLGHNGIDYRASIGTPCFAVIDGTVTNAGEDYQGGREVRFVSDERVVNGVRYRLEFIYYHLKEWHVKAGERVYRGQPIGLTGNTGKYTTGAHLHFGMKIQKFTTSWVKESSNGYFGAFDPLPFFTYKPMAENPYNIFPNTLVQLTEGVGGFGLWDGEYFFVDALDKLLASWLVRNKGDVGGKTLAVAQVVWDSYKKVNLKKQPI